jgi:hypothetical protein
MTRSRIVHLSAEETKYLLKLKSEDDSLSAILRHYPDISINGSSVSLNVTTTEILRDYFTERLARVGFDAKYEPNKEGRLLEKLIDTFFLA